MKKEKAYLFIVGFSDSESRTYFSNRMFYSLLYDFERFIDHFRQETCDPLDLVLALEFYIIAFRQLCVQGLVVDLLKETKKIILDKITEMK